MNPPIPAQRGFLIRAGKTRFRQALGDLQAGSDATAFAAVISGLPLLSMPASQVAAVIQGVFERQLHADGAFYQFTYGPRCPLPRRLLQRLDLEAVRIGSVLFNLPPTAVYRIGRRQRNRVAT
ncbi:hypothetical protein [Rhodanobacter sp. C05]|uniref:hypothetical protein n=1 Tax=Rhodanobacter sp. C05 TaxID=1945855 RepID=UPI0020C2FF02|nr:hypothetical protein [Rhodanobacter sp. C05]